MKNKKIVWVIIGIISIALIALAITYAYWQITRTQTGENEITTACLDITLVDAESGNTGITLQNQYPISDSEGMQLTPYKFTVTNNCNTEVDYQIALESIGDSATSISQGTIKIMLDENTAALLNSYTSVTPTVTGAYVSHKLGTGTLAAKDEEGSIVTHELRLWLDESAPVSENNKSYTGKISVTIGQGIVAAKNLRKTILASYGGENAITEITDFTTASTGLYKAEDDYGTSYYLRGDITNNYVQIGEYKSDYYNYGDNTTGVFATLDECIETIGEDLCNDYEEKIASKGEKMYWRIVRINGDGTIRLIYNSAIGNVFYGENSGYMNGTVDDPYSNIIDSNIKKFIDLWYVNYLKEQYGSYIADSIFCNDRTVSSIEGDYEYYAPNTRLYSTSDPTPLLTCTNKNDRFTVDDETYGNGALTNPIALITADEIVMAGLGTGDYFIYNTNGSYYHYNSEYFWTMSPSFSHSSDNYISRYVLIDDGNLFESMGTDDAGTGRDGYITIGVRPVINIKADTLFTGSGTIDDPYVLAN